uniref:Uncharacterized protein n=1 Tax=Oncorhynchus kisutch TaxID=8019 RepID=A0A8C7K6C2_ONCKI
MSSVYAASVGPLRAQGRKKPLKLFCKGEESWTDLIEAHKDCMKGYLKISPRYVAKLASFTGKNT